MSLSITSPTGTPLLAAHPLPSVPAIPVAAPDQTAWPLNGRPDSAQHSRMVNLLAGSLNKAPTPALTEALLRYLGLPETTDSATAEQWLRQNHSALRATLGPALHSALPASAARDALHLGLETELQQCVKDLPAAGSSSTPVLGKHLLSASIRFAEYALDSKASAASATTPKPRGLVFPEAISAKKTDIVFFKLGAHYLPSVLKVRQEREDAATKLTLGPSNSLHMATLHQKQADYNTLLQALSSALRHEQRIADSVINNLAR